MIEVGGGAHEQKNLQTHSFFETQFVAVTAYQNTDVRMNLCVAYEYLSFVRPWLFVVSNKNKLVHLTF